LTEITIFFAESRPRHVVASLLLDFSLILLLSVFSLSSVVIVSCKSISNSHELYLSTIACHRNGEAEPTFLSFSELDF
jgi:hypothetical protein